MIKYSCHGLYMNHNNKEEVGTILETYYINIVWIKTIKIRNLGKMFERQKDTYIHRQFQFQ
jgi:hypothetical protein